MFFDDTSQDDDDNDERIIQAAILPTTIMEDALKASINFVEVCSQHTAYVTGRQTIESKIKTYKQSKCNYSILHLHVYVHINTQIVESFIAHRKIFS